MQLIEKRRIVKMTKFVVIVRYEGLIDYEVEAETEEEARNIADQMFSEEDDRKISASVAYYDICDCWEFNEENC